MLGVMLGAQIAGRVYPRIGPRRMLTGGLLGLSQAQNIVPLQAAAFATISPADTGAAPTMYNTGRQIGQATGHAVSAGCHHPATTEPQLSEAARTAA